MSNSKSNEEAVAFSWDADALEWLERVPKWCRANTRNWIEQQVLVLGGTAVDIAALDRIGVRESTGDSWKQSSRIEKNFQALGWFVKARYGAILGIFLTFLVARLGFQFAINPLPVGLILAVLLGGNLLFDWHWRRMRELGLHLLPCPVTRFERRQILVDLFCLSILIHYYGGIENPFSIFFFWHIAIGSILRRWAAALARTTLTIGLYLSIIWGEYFGIWPHHPVPGLFVSPVYDNFAFVLAVSMAFVLGGYALYFLIATISFQLRRRGELLESLTHELEDKNAQLIRHQELREGFFRVVAHEMKRPVAASIQMLDVVLQMYSGALPAEAKKMLDRARLRTASILQLVKDLVEFARLEKAEEGPQRVPATALCGVLEEIVAEYTESAQAVSVQLTHECTAGNASGDLLMSADDFSLVAHNLISNAIRYSFPESTVTVRFSWEDGALQLEVSDQGIGISDEDQKKLFQEFFRSSVAKKHSRDGSGLGLAIVKRIIDNAGGRIDCHSELGKGTTFTVTLPCLPE